MRGLSDELADVSRASVWLFCVRSEVSNHRGTPECVGTPGGATRGHDVHARRTDALERSGVGERPGVLTHSGVPR